MEIRTSQYFESNNPTEDQNIFEIKSVDDLPRLLDRLMIKRGLNLLGIRGTCSVQEPVTLENKVQLLTPSQIAQLGQERSDRKTFLVTKYVSGGQIHQRTSSWAQTSTREIQNLLRSHKLSVLVNPTFIVYNPDFIYTTQQNDLENYHQRTVLRDLQGDCLRTFMQTDDSQKAIIGIVVVKPN